MNPFLEQILLKIMIVALLVLTAGAILGFLWLCIWAFGTLMGQLIS